MAAALLLPISSSSPHSISFQRPHESTRTSLFFPPLTHKKSLTNPHFIPLCSPSSASLVEENSSSTSSDGVSTIEDAEKLPFRGCKACGREELEKGCNGEGRVQGGIATVPGFGWWPIKAYRPCPGFVASGGRYRRRGQSMDEVAWGGTEREVSVPNTDEVQSSSKKESPKKFKRFHFVTLEEFSLSKQNSGSWAMSTCFWFFFYTYIIEFCNPKEL